MSASRAALIEALRPFAALAEYIAEEHPNYDSDAQEVQVENWPYTISVGWLRRAQRLVREITAMTAQVDTRAQRRDVEQARPVRAGSAVLEEDAPSPCSTPSDNLSGDGG